MTSLVLVGVDPGKVTGVAVWREANLPQCAVDVAEVTADVVTWQLRRMLRGEQPTLIGCERMVGAGNGGRPMSVQPDADRVIGAVRSLADESVVRLVYQSAGPAKRVGSAKVLRDLGWYLKTPDGHANDAMSHVLLLLATFYPERFAKLVL